jgi:hypothetical protein
VGTLDHFSHSWSNDRLNCTLRTPACSPASGCSQSPLLFQSNRTFKSFAELSENVFLRVGHSGTWSALCPLKQTQFLAQRGGRSLGRPLWSPGSRTLPRVRFAGALLTSIEEADRGHLFSPGAFISTQVALHLPPKIYGDDSQGHSCISKRRRSSKCCKTQGNRPVASWPMVAASLRRVRHNCLSWIVSCSLRGSCAQKTSVEMNAPGGREVALLPQLNCKPL